ncbi:diguanylate cyclase [uncultured Gammaproteobacteria bacterium]
MCVLELDSLLEDEQPGVSALVQNLARVLWDVIVLLDGDGVCRYVSPSVHETLASDARDIRGRCFAEYLVYPEEAASFTRDFGQALASRVPVIWFGRIRRGDGSYAWVDVRLCVTAGFDLGGASGDGTPAEAAQAVVLAVIRDISPRMRSESALRDHQRRLNKAGEVARIGYWEYLPKEDRGDWSPVLYNVWGQDSLGFTPTLDALISSIHPNDQTRLALLLRTPQADNRAEFRIVRPDGTVRHILFDFEVESDGTGQLIRYHGIAQDITGRKRSEELILRQATLDLLTSLPNRALFKDRLQQAVHETRREAGRGALLFINLDRFKWVNDTLGHDVGDHVLIEIAHRLTRSVRPQDTVARLGGDEFAIVMPRTRDPLEVESITRRILTELAEPIEIGRHEAALSCSIGITLFPDDGDTPSVLLSNADRAMYQAKQRGKNCFAFFSVSANPMAIERLGIAVDLVKALRNQEFLIHYQPIIDLQRGLPVGVEALVRWSHPTRGMLPPDRFIPVSEETGLIEKITEWLIPTAQAEIAGVLRADYNHHLAVNLSAREFHDDHILVLLRRAVESRIWPVRNMIFEITESVMIANVDHVREVFNTLTETGAAIALDDFGTGYSSLGYLKRLPIGYLKIDRSFVADVTGNRESQKLVEAIVAMAHGLNAKVIAEGVENEVQYQALRACGCELAQGYFFARPMPAPELTAFFRDFRIR